MFAHLVLVAALAPAAELQQLSKETLAKVDAIAPFDARHGRPGEEEIPALGKCTRPTERERAVIRTIVAKDAELAFGCMDARGVIVNVSYDQNRTGVWEVLLVAGGKATKIASYRGTSRQDYMEWANEVSLGAGLLVDLDGDGVHDALFIKNVHEGGAVHSDEELSVWFSKSGRTVQSGTFGDEVGLARGQLAPPIVLEVSRMNDSTRYRCLEANGTIDLCAAIETARRADRMVGIANEWGTGFPDRDRFAEELDVVGVEPNRKARLLQAAPETARETQVARVIALFVAPSPVLRFGEVVEPQPPDPRIAEMTALGGDAPCAMSAADQRAVAGKLDRRAKIVAACGDQKTGYIAAHWEIENKDDMTARDVVYAIGNAAVTPIAKTSVTGPKADCSACGTSRPGVAIDSSFFRHGAALVALVIDHSTEHAKLTLAVDGKPTIISGQAQFAPLREPYGELRDVIEIDTAVWHWDGAWKQAAGPLATRLAKERARFEAIWALQSFDARKWSIDPDVRTKTHELLEAAGADAATLVQVPES